MDELADDVGGRLGGQARVRRRILAVIVEDVDDSEPVHIYEAFSDFERDPGDLVNQAIRQPEECGFERGGSRANHARRRALS